MGQTKMSVGCLAKILRGDESIKQITLQIIASKRILADEKFPNQPVSERERYRFKLSDSVNSYIYCMLGLNSNHLMPQLTNFTIIKIKKISVFGLPSNNRLNFFIFFKKSADLF